jgi:hypothetical protein
LHPALDSTAGFQYLDFCHGLPARKLAAILGGFAGLKNSRRKSLAFFVDRILSAGLVNPFTPLYLHSVSVQSLPALVIELRGSVTVFDQNP